RRHGPIRRDPARRDGPPGLESVRVPGVVHGGGLELPGRAVGDEGPILPRRRHEVGDLPGGSAGLSSTAGRETGSPAARRVERGRAAPGPFSRAPGDEAVARSPTDDSRDLAAFGYKPVLDRTLGGFSSFAAGFSYISILTGVFQMFYVGYGAG